MSIMPKNGACIQIAYLLTFICSIEIIFQGDGFAIAEDFLIGID